MVGAKLKRMFTPVKFSWRNIPKMVSSTLDVLGDKIKSTTDDKEKVSLRYLIRQMKDAFKVYLSAHKV